jgi:AcrR family transcriptional regulator
VTSPEAVPEGRRARKRRETRDRIADAAMKLFLDRGYEATTMDDVADAADVSRRSLFDYFPTKEDVLFARQDDFVIALGDELRKRPKDEPWPVLVEHAFTHAIADAISPENIAIDALVNSTPALQPRRQIKYVRLEDTIAGALAERGKTAQARKQARLLAAVVVAGFRVMASAQGPEPRKADGVAIAFREFWRNLREFADAGLATRPRSATKSPTPRHAGDRK